jgi:putative DNA primase/helicase
MEMVGYSLLTSCRFEKFILLIGVGGNGKTKVLETVEALVGKPMVCAVQPSQLDNKVQRAHLATNHMPHSRDFSDTMFRRAIVLTFNNKFEGVNKDPNLIEKLKAELPGILTLALGAIRGVIQKGDFTDVASSNVAKREWQLNCDQAAQYFEERLLKAPTEKVGYQDYRNGPPSKASADYER